MSSTYFTSMFATLPTDINQLHNIQNTWIPFIYKYPTDLNKLVEYLSDPKCVYDKIKTSPIYVSGTDVSDDIHTTLNKITSAPTMHFRQVLLQLSHNPNEQKVQQYMSIMNNWINKSFYPNIDLNNSKTTTEIFSSSGNLLEFFNCMIVIGFTFKEMSSLLSIVDQNNIISWISKLYSYLENIPQLYKYGNNIAVTGYIARIIFAIILNKPLLPYSQWLNNFVETNVTIDGFMKTESRENMTIAYHERCMIMFMLCQCLLFQSGNPVVSISNQNKLYNVLSNLKKVESTSDINAPSFFHTKTKWTGTMRPANTLAEKQIEQMMNYCYKNADINTLINTTWSWSSMTFGVLIDLLLSINKNKGITTISL